MMLAMARESGLSIMEMKRNNEEVSRSRQCGSAGCAHQPGNKMRTEAAHGL